MVTGIRPGLEGVCHLSYYLVCDLVKILSCADFGGEDRRDESLLTSKLNERYLAGSTCSDIRLHRQPLMEQGIKPCPLQGRPPAKRSNTKKRNILKQCIRGIGNEYVTVIFPMIIHPCWSAMCAVMLISSIYKI